MNKDQKILDELIGKKIPIEDFEWKFAESSQSKMVQN